MRLLWYIFLFLTKHNLSCTLFLIFLNFLTNLSFNVLIKCVLIKKRVYCIVTGIKTDKGQPQKLCISVAFTQGSKRGLHSEMLLSLAWIITTQNYNKDQNRLVCVCIFFVVCIFMFYVLINWYFNTHLTSSLADLPFFIFTYYHFLAEYAIFDLIGIKSFSKGFQFSP